VVVPLLVLVVVVLVLPPVVVLVVVLVLVVLPEPLPAVDGVAAGAEEPHPVEKRAQLTIVMRTTAYKKDRFGKSRLVRPLDKE
jgi:hypothetical protein